jgi:putative transposase
LELTDEHIELLRAQVKDVDNVEALMSKNGPVAHLLSTIINGMLEAERDHHLGYPAHAVEGHHTGNSRNGYSKKTVQTTYGQIPLAVPRDRDGSFTPTVVPPHRRVLGTIEDAVLALYAIGVSTRDISEQLEQVYGPVISPTLVSQITDSVLPMMLEWQNRPLDPLYAFLFLDAIHLKVRHEGRVQTMAVYTCLGVNIEGEKQLLGLWIGEQEGARFWQCVLTELANRGVKDVLIACIDGLSGFPEAIASVFPRTEVQECIIHTIRRSMNYVATKNQPSFMADLKQVYKAATESEATQAFERLESTWEKLYPQAITTWRNNWQYLSTFFAYPAAIRKIIYTTNPVESVHRQMRKVTKNKSALPSKEAALKLLFLHIRRVEKKWNAPMPNWNEIRNYLMISHRERVEPYFL